jgi:hypothetical protein
MASSGQESNIDRASYELGVIASFAEVVSLGVKKLALSSPLEPELFERIRERAEEIAARYAVKTYHEKSLLVTDLFSEDIAEGMYVILLYRDEKVLDTYLTLKERRRKLAESGEYTAGAGRELAREFGRLLSYPPEKIEEILSKRP